MKGDEKEPNERIEINGKKCITEKPKKQKGFCANGSKDTSNDRKSKKPKKKRNRKGEKMKIKIDCCFVTNRGNGRKCKVGPIVNGKLSDCVFKKKWHESIIWNKTKKSVPIVFSRCM